jgi:hypothetical protein
MVVNAQSVSSIRPIEDLNAVASRESGERPFREEDRFAGVTKMGVNRS